MLGKLLLSLALLPVVELFLLLAIGQRVGAGPTIALVLGSGFLGAWIVRREGSRVLQSWQGSLHRGEIPKDDVISSVLVLLAGALLVVPGVVTDAMALVLLVPWTRHLVANAIRRRLEQRLAASGGLGEGGLPGGFAPFGLGGPFGLGSVFGRGGNTFEADGPRGTVIDVDVVEPAPASDEPPAEPRSTKREA